MTSIVHEAIPIGSPTGSDCISEDELRFQRLKVMIHEELVDSLELSMLAEVRTDVLGNEVRVVAEELCQDHAARLDGVDRERMLDELVDEVFGLGPLERLIRDASISDILVNHAHEVYVERAGRLEQTDVLFADDAHLMRIIQRVVSRVGRRIDEVSPMVDARLADGSRVNAVVPPLALNGPTLSIRRFGAESLKVDDLVENRTLTQRMVDFLSAAADARISFLISGGTGAGKTTLLNALTAFVPNGERLLTIEDSAELTLQHKHVIRMETRPANTEGSGEVTQRSLVRNALRMRPDRIIVGEVRGAEALDMLQAMNTGHEGSLTTIHANDCRDALARLEMMVAMSGFELPISVVRQYIAAGITLVLHMSRLKGGKRRLMRVSEITGVDDDGFQLQDIFLFEQTGVDDAGIAQGEFLVTGYRPACLSRLRSAGIRLPDELFDKRHIILDV
ncbi:MAG: pilus assembly protein CpaF [Planctomycetaceae bacterium]|nr:pilus assembly protein CpaF [Planctomycetaceae bacterium]